VISTKEAFCDIWAIDILKIPISEYIPYILDTLITTKNYPMVLSYFNETSREITPDSLELRLNLLMDLMFSESIFKEEEILSKLDDLFSKLLHNHPDKADLFEAIKIDYNDYISTKTYLRSDLNYIAFYKQKQMFESIKDEESICKFEEMYSHDLSEDIYIDDLDYLLNNLSLDDVSNDAHSSSIAADDIELINSISPLNFHNNYMQMEYVRSIGEYISKISSIIGNQQQSLWFRGVCNDKFSLLPSIFRKCDENLSLYVNQSNVIKYSFLQTKSMKDIWDLPVEQQTACLQHYGAATNLLDFSLEMLVALHFALNPDIEDDKKEIDNGNFQPVVYLFDPVKYCNVVRILHDENLRSSIKYNIRPYEFDINPNDTKMSKYFVMDSSFDYLIRHTKQYNQNYTSGNRCDEFPIPIIIRQSNPRIVAQDGTFVAFSLDAKPTLGTGEKRYSYVDLLTIRKRYCEFCFEKGIPFQYDFLYTIYIDKCSVSKIRRELLNLNIGKYRVYPEFKNLISEGMKRFLGNKSQ
ncbi:MAG: FRG domain-containing protein, partial [Oscillospiraceae bacterium]|nr:FRG domain-containing protein [Oscillospiraceae bacterium]